MVVSDMSRDAARSDLLDAAALGPGCVKTREMR